MDIDVDETLISNPTNTDYVQGMKEAVNEIKEEEKKRIAQKEVDKYIMEQMADYHVTETITHCYRIECFNSTLDLSDENNYALYYRTDISDDEVSLEPVP